MQEVTYFCNGCDRKLSVKDIKYVMNKDDNTYIIYYGEHAQLYIKEEKYHFCQKKCLMRELELQEKF